jgi:hypothetical protein
VSYPRHQLARDFKRTVYWNASNITTTSTSYVDISANFPALDVRLQVGDIVDLEFYAAWGRSGTGLPISVDWLIDRPVSANTSIGTLAGASSAGTIELGSNALDVNTVPIRALFTATEAGAHTFTPQWKVNAGTASIVFASPYGHSAFHMVRNLGPADPN